MPYGDLAAQRVQRFETEEDLVRHDVTIEEREEYEPHMATGSVVWAGVDYGAIVDAADDEADVLIWDGGNNDTPFLKPTVFLTVVDPHRPGHESRYYPGETNVRMADAILVNKIETAAPADVEQVLANVKALNPRAVVLMAASPIQADDESVLRGRRVLAIEDGPTVTHGEMSYGAATIAAQRLDCDLVDPRPYAVGEIAETFRKYPTLGPLLPAMGYGETQVRDLEATIAAAAEGGVEAVAIGTPIDLARLVRIPVPFTRVRYELDVRGEPTLEDLLEPVIRAAGRARK
jgi:predicted GTPase